jgi:hypothetical protein
MFKRKLQNFLLYYTCVVSRYENTIIYIVQVMRKQAYCIAVEPTNGM